jgi:hypothetical protein
MTHERCRSRLQLRHKKENRTQPEEDFDILDLSRLRVGDSLWIGSNVGAAFFFVEKLDTKAGCQGPHVGTLYQFDPIEGGYIKHDEIALRGAYADFFSRSDQLVEDGQVVFSSLDGSEIPNMGYVQKFIHFYNHKSRV